jgi:DNA-binding transcriptional ArsR family regulator
MSDAVDPAVLDECRRLAATWAPVLQALGNPERLLITLWLAGTISSVRDLEHVTGLSQSLVSYHLRALREAGLVTATAHGRANLYQLAHPDLDKLALLVGNLDARTFPVAPGPDAPPVTAAPTPNRR